MLLWVFLMQCGLKGDLKAIVSKVPWSTKSYCWLCILIRPLIFSKHEYSASLTQHRLSIASASPQHRLSIASASPQHRLLSIAYSASLTQHEHDLGWKEGSDDKQTTLLARLSCIYTTQPDLPACAQPANQCVPKLLKSEGMWQTSSPKLPYQAMQPMHVVGR